jgi:hypothetical protein
MNGGWFQLRGSDMWIETAFGKGPSSGRSRIIRIVGEPGVARWLHGPRAGPVNYARLPQFVRSQKTVDASTKFFPISVTQPAFPQEYPNNFSEIQSTFPGIIYLTNHT